jgi:hypothetical protein
MNYGIYVSRDTNRWIVEGWCKPGGKLVQGTREEVEVWLANAWTIPGVKYEVRAM